MLRHYLSSTSLVAILLVAVAPWGARADGVDTDPEDGQEIEEVIVIGQKSAKSLQEVTASVSVETGVEIEREPLADLFDIVLRVPNVTASLGEQGFAIRGIDQRGVSGSGLTLTVYVDDAIESAEAVGGRACGSGRA